MRLTAKQKRFCEEYVVSRDATAAALSAGYSEKTADVIGSQNLRKLKVQEYINELQSEQVERLQISSDELTEFFRGRMNDKLAKDSDRIKAAENLAKRIGYYEEDNQQRQPVVSPQIILK